MAEQRTNENEVPGDAGYDPKKFDTLITDEAGVFAAHRIITNIIKDLSILKKQIALLETKVNMIQNKIGGK